VPPHKCKSAGPEQLSLLDFLVAYVIRKKPWYELLPLKLPEKEADQKTLEGPGSRTSTKTSVVGRVPQFSA
jgi:hypothetical protein